MVAAMGLHSENSMPTDSGHRTPLSLKLNSCLRSRFGVFQLALFVMMTMISVPRHIYSLKCFAGDPLYQHECTSLSYCLHINSRTGRSQWSCDGNSFNQVSLCSNLGLMEDLVAGNGVDGGPSAERDSGPIAVFEQSLQQAAAAAVVAAANSPVGGRRDELAEDDMYAQYYRQQQQDQRGRGEVHEQKRAFFSSSKREDYGSDGVHHHRGRLASGGAIRYYAGQSRCFDGGDLGRICCCSTNYCNGASHSPTFAHRWLWWSLTIALTILISITPFYSKILLRI